MIEQTAPSAAGTLAEGGRLKLRTVDIVEGTERVWTGQHYEGPLGPIEAVYEQGKTVTRISGPSIPDGMVNWGIDLRRNEGTPPPLSLGVTGRIGETDLHLSRQALAYRRTTAAVRIEGGGRSWVLRRRGMSNCSLERPDGSRVGWFMGWAGANGAVNAGADALEVALLVLTAAAGFQDIPQPKNWTSANPWFQAARFAAMAALDVARRRVRLSLAELGVASVLTLDPVHPSLRDPESSACLRGLEAAGVVADGHLVGFVAELVGLVAAPKLRIVIEFYSGPHRVVHSVWADEWRGTLGVSEVDDALDLSPVSTLMVPWVIADRVGLGFRPDPSPDAGPVTLPAAALNAAAAALGGGDVDAADAALAEAGVPNAEERREVAAVVAGWRVSWCLTSVWSNAEGERETRTVSIVDAGGAGYWRSVTEGEGAAQRVTLEPLAPRQVWREIVAMVPGMSELAEAYVG